MEKVAAKFPFSSSFHFREDERAGLEALFERVFFDRAFAPEARKALARTLFAGSGDALGQAGPDGTSKAQGPDGTSRAQGPGGTSKAEGPDGKNAGKATVSALGGGRGLRGGSSRKGGVAGKGASRVPEPGSSPESGPSPEADARYVLLCRGPDGVGKTRIFRHLSDRARGQGIPVYEVFHHEVEGIPFKPFLHAIRTILRDHDPGAVLQKKYRYGLEGLIPDAFADRDEASSDRPSIQKLSSERLEAQKVRVFDAITQLLLEVTARKPLLLLVHDLHWSDRSTIELLGYIGRNLALRNAKSERRVPDHLLFDYSSGPEVDGFESEEWRTLARKSAQLAGYLEGVPGRAGEEPHPRPGNSKALPPAARLLILANYRGFSEKTHYLEESLRSLGDESFAYHSELKVLDDEEAGQFIEQSLEGTTVSEHTLEVQPDAVSAIHAAAEGFPSFTRELFRALYLDSNRSEPNGTLPWVWSEERVEKLLRGRDASLDAGGAGTTGDAGAGAVASSEKDGREVVVFPAPPDEPPTALSRRHAILRLRLADATPREWEILRVIAVARRPVSVDFVVRVLEGPQRGPSGSAQNSEADGGRVSGEDGGALVAGGVLSDGSWAASASDATALALAADSVREVLEALEQRGLIERRGLAPGLHGESNEEGYCFRLWDYTAVVQESLESAATQCLHQRIGEVVLEQLEAVSDENAYEVYYHLYRGVEPRSALQYGRLAAERFWRSFALEKARRVEASLLALLTQTGDDLRRIEILEEMAHVSLALKDPEGAEKALRRVQTEGASILSPERRLEVVFSEAAAAATQDPGRALKILGRGSKLLPDENSRLGVRLQLATAKVRLGRQDIKRAINFCLKGIGVAQKLGAVPELGNLYSVLATAFYRKGDYSHAVDNFQRALTAFEEFGKTESSVEALDELGRVYLERGHYFRAARYLYKSLEIRRRLHDVAGLCKSYDQLALVYLRSGDDLKTIDNLNRTLVLKERIGNFAGLNPTLAALGDLYQRLGSYEQAIFYFKWEIQNSQRIGDTEGLVEAFAKLGRVYFELGDLRQSESLCKQVSILASEFKLRSQEADGALLDGHILAFARKWVEAEKSFKLSSEVHGKLGHRRREASALLDLAEVKLARELYDEALKFTSKGQIIADEVKALDLQVRAQTIKGDIYRFLKGGNVEKAQEFLQKALELSQDLSDAEILFKLFYALAKTGHAHGEFAEAANYYGKAELIVKRISDGLSEDLAAKFLEDDRRKVFAEDLARFRRESLSRTGTAARGLAETAVLGQGIKERPSGVADYKELGARVLRLHANVRQVHFHEHLLGEALEMTGADRGFILRVRNRQYLPVAFQGFGKNPVQHPEFMAASHIAQDAVRRGHSVLAVGGEDDSRPGRESRLPLGGLLHRSILCSPFMTDERIFGGVYLDKPVALGQFSSRDKVLMDLYAQHCAVALNNRREFETAVREPVTGLHTPSYFVDRLREAYRWYNLHGKGFVVLSYFLPSLEETIRDGRGQLGGRLSQELAEVLPHGVTMMCWGTPLLHILLEDGDTATADAVGTAVCERLSKLFNEEVPMTVVPAESQYQEGAEIYFEARRRLLPPESDQKVLNELRGILTADITLRDAKKILERHKIQMTLRKTGGNITHAARELGIHRPQLSNLLKKHALKREFFEDGGAAGPSSD